MQSQARLAVTATRKAGESQSASSAEAGAAAQTEPKAKKVRSKVVTWRKKGSGGG